MLRSLKQYSNIIPSLLDIKHFSGLNLETAARKTHALCYYNPLNYLNI